MQRIARRHFGLPVIQLLVAPGRSASATAAAATAAAATAAAATAAARILAAGLLVCGLLGCATPTNVVDAWKDPRADHLELGRTLVVFQHDSEASRRSVEDALAARIPGAVPAYRFIPTDELSDLKSVRARVSHEGFQSVLVARLLDIDREWSWSPGVPTPFDPFPPFPLYGPVTPYGSMPYGSLWGAWGYGWGLAYTPGTLRSSTVVSVELLLYELPPAGPPEGRLVWASRSETMDPRSMKDLAASVIRASSKVMEGEGLVATGVFVGSRERG